MSKLYPEPRRYSPHESMLDVLGRRVLAVVGGATFGFVFFVCWSIGERQ